MPYRFDTQGLTSQQKSIINQRDRNEKLLRESSKQNVAQDKELIRKHPIGLKDNKVICGLCESDMKPAIINDLQSDLKCTNPNCKNRFNIDSASIIYSEVNEITEEEAKFIIKQQFGIK